MPVNRPVGRNVPFISIHKVVTAPSAIFECGQGDEHCHYDNIDNTHLGMVQNAHEWIKDQALITNDFSEIRPDQFMLRHKKQQPTLKDMFNDYIKQSLVQFKLKKVVLPAFGDWRDEVASWFNSWIESGIDRKFKLPQLYLFGPSNSGKTTFVNEVLFRGIPKDVIFKPIQSKNIFSWAEFRHDVHAIVNMNEFNIYDHNQDFLKNVMEGNDQPLPQKHKKAKMIGKLMPMIFTSNYPLPDNVNAGMRERFMVVDTSATCWGYTPKDPYVDILKGYPSPYDIPSLPQPSSPQPSSPQPSSPQPSLPQPSLAQPPLAQPSLQQPALPQQMSAMESSIILPNLGQRAAAINDTTQIVYASDEEEPTYKCSTPIGDISPPPTPQRRSPTYETCELSF